MKVITSDSFKGQYKTTNIVTFKVVDNQKRFRAMVLCQNGETVEQILKHRSEDRAYDIKIEETK